MPYIGDYAPYTVAVQRSNGSYDVAYGDNASLFSSAVEFVGAKGDKPEYAEMLLKLVGGKQFNVKKYSHFENAIDPNMVYAFVYERDEGWKVGEVADVFETGEIKLRSLRGYAKSRNEALEKGQKKNKYRYIGFTGKIPYGR